MPESVTDRCTKAHEYIFMLAKSPRYYFDATAIAEPVAESTIARISQDVEHQKGSNRQPGKTNGPMKAVVFGGKKYGESQDEHDRTKSGKPYVPKQKEFDHSMAAGAYDIASRKHGLYITRNKRDVWTCATANFKAAHFAVFPPKLIEPCILAGCPVGGWSVIHLWVAAPRRRWPHRYSAITSVSMSTPTILTWHTSKDFPLYSCGSLIEVIENERCIQDRRFLRYSSPELPPATACRPDTGSA